MSLRDFLLAVLSGAVAFGPVLYTVVEHSQRLASLTPAQRRLAVAGAAALIGLGAWGLAAFLGYVPAPGDRVRLAEGIWQYGVLTGFATFTSATLIHGQRKLQAAR